MLKYSTYQSIYETETMRSESVRSNRKMIISNPLFIKLALAALIILIGCTGVVRVFAGPSNELRHEKNVVVQAGDTLWGIAETHKPDDMDTRAYIRLVRMNNDIQGSYIQAGDVLSLPQF